MSAPCPRCDGDGYVDVFDDEGHGVVGARDCDACGGSALSKETGAPDLMAALKASLGLEASQ